MNTNANIKKTLTDDLYYVSAADLADKIICRMHAIAARRLLQTAAEGHSIGGHDLHVTTSIGVSVYPDDGLDAETLIKNADTAMYQAKENGHQSYQKH
jgi:diguanylate cyclase (GGDEF)-like protein